MSDHGWVWFTEAYGPEGATKFAITAEKEAGPNEIAFMRGKASGQYLAAFGVHCAHMRVSCAPVEHRVFPDLAQLFPIDPANPTERRPPYGRTRQT